MISFFESTHKMIPGVFVTTRATVVQTAQGLVVISPIDFTHDQRLMIQTLAGESGDVVAVIEPNLYHTTHAASSRNWFPRSELWGVDGHQKKKPKVPWSKIFGQDAWPYGAELEAVTIRGAKKINEIVFLHRATRTLIVTDLVFNMPRRTGVLSPLILRSMGTYRKFAVSGLWISVIDDEKAFSESAREVLALDFDRLVMAHGEIIASGGKAKLEAALRARKLI